MAIEGFLERVEHTRMTELGDFGPGTLEYARTRHGVRVRAARASTLRPDQLRTLTEFRIAQYVRIGFIDTVRLAELLAAGEPLAASSPNDVHVLAMDEAGRLLCTAVLRAPSGPAGTEVPATARMADRDRPLFPVELTHGWGIFNGLRVLPDLPVARVMELGGFVKAQATEPFSELAVRAPVEVGVALFRVITGPLALPVSAIVGDLEPKVAKLNLEFFGIQMVMLQGTAPCVPEASFLEPRYDKRDVRPFAFLTGDFVTALPRLAAVERALDLPGRKCLLALLELRNTQGAGDWSTLAPAGAPAGPALTGKLPLSRSELAGRADELQQAPLLKCLSRTEIVALASNVEDVQVEAGETVIRAGEIDDALYLVRSGEAVAMLPGNTEDLEEPRVLGWFGQGDYFGEIAVLLGCRRTANVVAASDLSLWRLSGGHYRRYLERVTDVDREVSRAAARHVYGQMTGREAF
jgi:Cyclic nucleotide-binding domain